MKEIVKKYIEALIGIDIMNWGDNSISSKGLFTIKDDELIIKPDLVRYLNQFFGQEINEELIGDSIIEILKDKILYASTTPIDWDDLLRTETFNPFDRYSHLEYTILQNRPDITFRGKPTQLKDKDRIERFKETINSLPSLRNLTYIIPEPRDWSRLYA